MAMPGIDKLAISTRKLSAHRYMASMNIGSEILLTIVVILINAIFVSSEMVDKFIPWHERKT